MAGSLSGLQVAVHAIGDRAVDEVLAIFAQLAANSSTHSSGSGDGGSAEGRIRDANAKRRRPPHRIEHAQHISGPDAAAALAAAGVAVTPNPQHLLADRALLVQRLGAERAGPARTYAFRTLLQAGVVSAFGSDWPVVPLDPLAGELAGRVQQGCSITEAW